MSSSISRPLCIGLLAFAGCHATAGDQGHGMGADLATGVVGDDMASGGSTDDLATQPNALLEVQPLDLQMVTVTSGQPIPTVAYSATYGGQPTSVAWSIDRGDIGGILIGPAAGTTFTPSGTTAGLVTLTAGLNNITIKRQIMVTVVAQQNGATPGQSGQVAPTDPTQLNQGGGVGGVGGEGLGLPVTDTSTVTALGNPTSPTSQNLKFLYPYDKTVFPRGMLAPLVMWSWTPGDADAIQMSVKTVSGSYSWTGQFAKPAILATTMGPFVRSPIPQDVWEGVSNSASATDKVQVSLVVAKAGVAYGPITETWTIAPGRLSGIIYYNSYGTALAVNSGETAKGGGSFGGAVLSIHVGDTSPKLAAGLNNNATTGCRVCHSVSADGSRLVVQRGDNYSHSVTVDLKGTYPASETAMTNNATFPGMSPDGTMALTLGGALLPLPTDSSTITSLSGMSPNMGAPAFSPNGSLIAFNPMSMGAGSAVTNPTQKLLVTQFDLANKTYSTPVVVADYYTATNNNTQVRPGWPAFLPDNKSIVFQQQLVAGVDGNGNGQLYTRKGAKGQLAWTNTTDSTHVTALNQLNGRDSTGTSYLPSLTTANNPGCKADGTVVDGTASGTATTYDPTHSDDADLNYEPTVAPLASGGYVWVVFTSRRLYGNEATIPPFCSDPRGVDLVKNVTTKKLWVAAIDLNAAPGTDASHPAFYLPAQELLAGNSRGFWALDPCKVDGSDCNTGDQCCGGFCEPNGAGGKNVCSNMPPNASCSQESEKCTMDSDCCAKNNECINGFCSVRPIE